MLSGATSLLAWVLGLCGGGLILNGLTFYGILLLLVGAGLWLADFHWQVGVDSTGRLLAKGSPALLMIALMLGAAKGYLVTADNLLPAVSDQVTDCPPETDPRRLILVRLLDALH